MRTGNLQYWDESQAAFYEVYYLTVNHKASGHRFWLRATLLKTAQRDKAHFGGLWLAAFDPAGAHLAVHCYYPRAQCSFVLGRLALEITDSRLEESRWRADFEADGHHVDWELHWQPNASELWLVPQLIRRSGFNRADVCVPNVDIALYGHVTIDGERYEFAGDPAGQSHHWGRHYARGWLWAHCNDFDGAPGAWFEMLAVDLFGIGSRRLPLCMLAYSDGENELTVAVPLDFIKSRAAYSDGIWRAEFEKNGLRLEARLRAPGNGFVALPYISPHGENYTCHNSCLCDAELRLFKHRRAGCELLRELYSPDGAHAEFCTRENVTPHSFRFGDMGKMHSK